ncbi:glycosyltransferase [Tessaracoccus sp. G1721]
MSLLVVTVPGPVERDGSLIRLSAKTLSGLDYFARFWPGDVTHVTEATEMGSQEVVLGTRTMPIDQLKHNTIFTADRLKTIHQLRPDVVLTTLAMSELPLLEGLKVPFVAVTETDLRTRLEWARAERGGRLPSLRHTAFLLRLERRYRQALRRAAGIQANGWPSYTTYQGLTENPLLFFDSRINEHMLDSAPSKAASENVTLAFSGRWIRPKGIEHALAAFAQARATSDRDLRLELFGSGAYPLGSSAPDGITVHGNVDYETQWVPHVAAHVDLLLAPHPQSDPSCTYLEAAALGAPFISFNNRAAEWLAATHRLGWTAPIGDVTALAELITTIASDDAALRASREAARTFMKEHTMEREFGRRVEHLVACAGI